MVWGCFSYYGLEKLVFLPKNVRMNKNNYFELILDELDECMEKCNADNFIQDGAPCHTTKLIVDWFDFCNVSLLKPRSASSLDLNLIKNPWAYIKLKLKERDTSSLPRLKAAIQDIWDNIDAQYLHHLGDSLPKRLEKVKKALGHPINY